MKISELKDKSVEELTQLLDEKQLETFRLRMAKATGQLGNTHEIKSKSSYDCSNQDSYL